VEWYLNGPLGIGAGNCVLDERPSGEGALLLEVEITGLEPTLLAGGHRRVCGAPASGSRLRYADLWAVDANGYPLEAHMAVEGSKVTLVLDDARARYPLWIDPLAWSEQQTLRASDGEPGDVSAAPADPPDGGGSVTMRWRSPAPR